MWNFLRRLFKNISDENLEKIQILNRIKLFENCKEKDLVSIAQCCEFVNLEPGDMLIEKGTTGTGMYMLDSGKVNVKLSKEGEKVASMEAGEYVGEMSLLDREPRSAYIFSATEGRALFLPENKFLELIKENPETGSKILFVLARTLSRRLRSTNKQLRQTKEK